MVVPALSLRASRPPVSAAEVAASIVHAGIHRRGLLQLPGGDDAGRMLRSAEESPPGSEP